MIVRLGLQLGLRLSAFAILVAGLGFSTGCTSSKTEQLETSGVALRPLTLDERMADFEVAVRTVGELYGPMAYKERRYGYKLEDLVTEYRAKMELANSDDEAFGVLSQFLTRLQDGHVGATQGVVDRPGHYSGLFITPVEGRALVADLADESLTKDYGIYIGDEVLEVDGVPVFDYLPIILRYTTNGNDDTDRHFIYHALNRPEYMTELVPQKPTVLVKLANRAGETYTRNLVWKPRTKRSYIDTPYINPTQPFAVARTASIQGPLVDISQMGQEKPIFLTSEVERELGLIQVKPSASFLTKHGLSDLSKTPDLYAAMYKYQGRSMLLVRMATYSAEDLEARLSWYKALLDEYGRLADVFVIDQTHNPGGAVFYAEAFVSLFADSQARGLVNFLHPDRRWLRGMALWASETTGELKAQIQLAFQILEQSYDLGLSITPRPISFSGLDYIQPNPVTAPKPVLMLIDELAGSCGDLVPMLMKENGLATLFGNRTMGLGGNVEQVVQLPYSQTSIRLTRGHFATFRPDGQYDLDALVENNGVTPDIQYNHTVKDVRAGYVDFAKAFSQAAAELNLAPVTDN